MGVLACGRSKCPHIMCDRIILEHTHYICDECWEELLAARAGWPDTMTALEVQEAILTFMRTEPGTHKILNAEEIEREFRRLTGRA